MTTAKPIDPAIVYEMREVLRDIAKPALDLVAGALEATDESDDAAVGRRVRELVREYAATRIVATLSGESDPHSTKVRASNALYDRLVNGDDKASETDWIDYLSDGLSSLWPGEALPNGDLVTNLEPELEVMIEQAVPGIAEQCQAFAIAELAAVASRYQQRLDDRT